ncbi:hypothetical protein BS50DRAFT_619467 [Corynespora cassiicola Philippines]|uniref:Rhodopsin domain-containing protein n=1 Tax=Corynespora cassiicola Philippines TaxID=1448308 RepID=A0A2T2NTE5_CORCC|nr:hypothetical protein BS50DRAFT_619467 [Corynespora cassiicola Philippines]
MASERMLIEMLANPPDPNEPLPVSNRKETLYGTTVPFLVVTWMAVGMRLWVRLRIIREPGWDDFFVVLAAVLNTIATALVLKSIDYGLGQHFLYIGIEKVGSYLLYFYVENAIYISNTAVIKISLLFQYLRIFKAGAMRWICLSLLVLITLWGCAYGFIAWIPCFPVRGFWDRTINPTCYGYGFRDAASFIATFESHTALNMTFDLAVFLTPMVLFTEPNLKKKNVLAMTGIFLFGAVHGNRSDWFSIVFTSVWRLYTIVVNRAGTHPYIDFTWWPPISIILSCLEIDLAIICASMPIFWPVIEKSFDKIFVTHEVHIVEEHRDISRSGLAYELEHTKPVTRNASVKSASGHSRESLTREETRDVEGYYKDQYVVAQVDPFSDLGNGVPAVETSVDTKPKPKWNI